MSPHHTKLSLPSYRSHPLYSFRRLTIISALIGITLAIISAASAPAYFIGVWLFGTLTLIVSGLLALADLLIWAHKKHKEDAARWQRDRVVCRICAGRIDGEDITRNEAGVAAASSSPSTLPNMFATRDNDDDKPKWPIRWIMILDFLLTGVLFWMLSYEMSIANHPWYGRYPSDSTLVNCYATVPMGFSFVLHARCWWRQFRAREREAWVRGLGLGVGGPRGVEDVEAGLERIGRPYACGHERGQSRHMGPGCEGHAKCSSSSNANRPPSVAQRRNDLADSVEGLDREAIQALTSESWLPERSNTGERQSLLTRNDRPHTECTRYVSESNKSCVCSHLHACRSGEPASGPATHVHLHGPVGHTGNDDVDGHSKDAQDMGSIAIDRTTAYLTPSDLGATSASSSTALSSTRSQESCVVKGKKDVGDETDIEDEEIAANSALLSHGSKLLRSHDNDDGDDADIMVIEKAKKGKAKAQRQGKGKSREVGFEE